MMTTMCWIGLDEALRWIPAADGPNDGCPLGPLHEAAIAARHKSAARFIEERLPRLRN
jgi:hypothetical protein